MNKKIILVLIIVLVVFGAVIYGYFVTSRNSNSKNVQNVKVEIIAATQSPSPDISPAQSVSTTPASPNVGSLAVCQDMCGNGVCEKSDPKCSPGSVSCICLEDHQVCPEDCK